MSKKSCCAKPIKGPKGDPGDPPIWGNITGDVSDQADLYDVFATTDDLNAGLEQAAGNLDDAIAQEVLDRDAAIVDSMAETFPVSSEVDMLALAAKQGDVAIRSDESKSYILRVEPATTLGNWSELVSPGGGGSTAFADITGDPEDNIALSDALAIPTGNMLWVDVLGNDGTGTRGRFDLPYETPEAAKADAVAGDLIHVGPGDYVITSNLAKDGVDWHLESNVVFTITSDTSFNMFGDEDGAKSFNINGNGILRTDPTGGDSPVCHVIYISDPASVVSVRCLDILNVGSLAQGVQSDPVHQEGGNLTIECRDIEGRGHGASYPVWWTDGAMSIRARNIRQLSDGSGGVSITAASVNNPTGECYIKCDVIESTSIGSYAIQQLVFSGADAGSTAKAWIECLEIKGPAESNTQAIVKQSGGNLYITTQKITGGIFSNGDYGDLYINSQKFQGFATDDPTPGIISLSGARSHIAILQTVDGDNGDALVSIGGGEQNVSLGNFTRTNSGHGIEVTGGILNLSNTRIDTGVDDGSSPIKKSGGELSLNGVELIAESTQNSIAADDAQTVTATGSKCLQAVDANITIEGDLFYDDGTSPSGKVAMGNADGSWSWASLL